MSEQKSIRTKATLQERLTRRLGPPDANGCINWIGPKCLGYGRLRIGPAKLGQVSAHRVAWELANGPIPHGMFVCHKCDNRACVNVDHLFLGTQADNMKDKASKNRAWHPLGKSHPSAKMNDKTVQEVRRLYAKGGMTFRSLAAKFGVSHSAIYSAVRRRNWTHLP